MKKEFKRKQKNIGKSYEVILQENHRLGMRYTYFLPSVAGKEGYKANSKYFLWKNS